MDIGFLFGWAKENGIKLPTRDDGNINVPAAFALYDEWKKRNGGDKQGASDTDSNGGKSEEKGAAAKSEVVELDDNSELARLIASSDKNKYDTIRRYLIENFGGKELELSDGKKAIIDKSDAKELAHKAYGKRIAELYELKQIIANAVFAIQKNVVEHNKFNAFRYYEAKTKYKGNTSRIVLNVGVEKANEKLHLYSITNHPKDK